MSFKIERGLFKYDFIDHHAILGVPLDADIKEIRKRYLKIARRLHPDSNANASEEERKLASDLLSKWVNPAYEKLSNERHRAEYNIVLSQMGKRLVQESASVELNSDLARQLASSPNAESIYKAAIVKISETQFEELKKALQIVAFISELNVVYLMKTAGKAFSVPPAPQPEKANSANPANPNVTASQTPKSTISQGNNEGPSVAQYIRRAQDLINKNQFAPARVELQDALKLQPNNSQCHSLIGVVYLKQNQTTMAKVHFDRALQLDPKDETALEGKRKLEKLLGQKTSNSKVATPANNAAAKQSQKSDSGGLFGGLFGGKKK
jgi:curved DNA-binding protein CbpA